MPYISPRHPLIILRLEWIGFAVCFILFIVCMISAGILSPTIIRALAIESYEERRHENEDQLPSPADEQLAQSIFFIALLTLGFFGIILLVIQCALNILLRNGIYEESPKKCQTWMIIHGVLLVMSILFVVSRIVKPGSNLRSFVILAPVFGWLYRVLALLVLSRYLEKLKRRELCVPNGHGQGRFGEQDRSVQSTKTEMTDIPL